MCYCRLAEIDRPTFIIPALYQPRWQLVRWPDCGDVLLWFSWCIWGAGHSSGSRALCCKGLNPHACGSILPGGCICSLGYLPFQPMVHNWTIKGCGMCRPVCGKVHIRDPLLLIGKSRLCGDSGFPLNKYVIMTISLMSNRRWYENQCSLEALF